MKTTINFRSLLKYFACSLLASSALQAFGQVDIILIDSSQATCSFRGLSVVSDKIVWVSGSKGTVGKSADGGKSWEWFHPTGFEKSDFRDIEAFDSKKAVIMASGTPAVILKTRDGGKSWKTVFRDDRPEMFLDAMDFWDKKEGVIVGDPIKGRFVILLTHDKGNSWRLLDAHDCPQAEEGEAVFAASGTSLRCYPDKKKPLVSFVSGGSHSRIFTASLPFKTETHDHDTGKHKAPWYVQEIPIFQGMSSTGAFSLSAYASDSLNSRLISVVGGNYLSDTVSEGWLQSAWYSRSNNWAYAYDDVWFRPKSISDPHGYRSCVEAIDKNKLIACGTSGVDIAVLDEVYKSWTKISDLGFHVVRKAKKGKAVFLAGGKGRIGILKY